MDNVFSSSYNSFSKNNNIDKDNFVASLNTARTSALKNAFMRVKEQPREYKNLYYEAEKAKFVYDNVANIYAGSDDPRESANAHYAAELITKLYPSIPEDIAEDSYRPLIKSITGDDMDAKTLFGVAWKTAKNVWNSFRLGGKVYLYSTAGKLFQEGLPDEIEANRDKEFRNAYDIFKQEKGLNQRVDYYDKDYNSFLEKVVLDAAEIIPSEILSFGPEVFGAVLSAVTRNPMFYSGARQLSKFTSAFMEAGSSAQELYEAGADWDTIRAVANTVGLINGSLEIIGNIPERGINERLFGMKALREAVGDTGTELTRGLASTVFAKMASTYALGLITEPATEVAQEFVSMYAMNLASKWQERNKGKAFEDQFTYTPEEMADAMKEIAASTFRGQLLLGLVGEGAEAFTNLRKGGQFLYNEEKNTGFKWDMGDLRKIIETRKYQDIAGSSVLVPKGMVDVNDTVKSYTPSELDDKNRPKEKLTPVKARNIGGEYVPINDAEMAKAKYMSENSEYGMYIEVVNDGNVDKEAMSAEGLRRIINSLPDEINKHQVDYSYTDNGDIVIGDKAELGAIVAGFVSANISMVENVSQTDNGYTVTVNGKNVNFTTEATDATEFNQADYVMEAKATADSQPKEMSEEWKKRVDDIRSRAENEALIKKNIKTRDFNREVSKVIDSRIADKDARKAEKAKIDEKVNTISAEYEKAMKASVERFPNSEFTKMLSGRNISDVATSLARATVMASAKMAQSMDTNISDFMNRVNFMFSPESMKEGKERAGWTTVNTDGTFDVNVTSFFDQTTGIHEMGHVYLSMIGDNYKSIEGFEKQFAKELEADGGKIGRNTQEAFAEALEAYVNEGLAKSEGLRRVFDLVLDALRNFVNSVRELLSPDKVAMFDNLFEKGIKGYNPELANTNDGTFYAKDVDTDYYKNADTSSVYSGSYKINKKALNQAYATSEMLGDALSDMSTEDFRAKYGIDTDGRMNVEEIRDALINKGREYVKKAGLGDENKFSDKMVEYVSQTVVNEINHRIDELGAENVPFGWYSTDVDLALEILADEFEEASHSDEAKSAFLLAWAITSQGENLTRNTKLAVDAYSYYREHGVFPVGEEIKANHQNEMRGNFKKVNDYILNYGSSLGALRQFLLEQNTAGNIRDYTGYNVSGVHVDDIYTYAGIFGPKIGGGFATNLLGKYDFGTIDLWMKRAYERLTGAHDIKGDAPSANGHAFMQKVLRRVTEIYNESLDTYAMPISMSDVQAVMWYNEKNLYNKIEKQNRESLGKSYSTAIAEYVVKKNNSEYNKNTKKATEARENEVQRLLDSKRNKTESGVGASVNEMSEQGSERPASAMVEDRDGEDTFLRKVQSLRAGLTESDKVRYSGRRRTVFGYTGFMEELGKEGGLPEYGRAVPYRSRELSNPKSVSLKNGRAEYSFTSKKTYSPSLEYAQDLFNSSLGKRTLNMSDFYELDTEKNSDNIKEFKRLFDRLKATQGQAQYRLSPQTVRGLKGTRLFVSEDGSMAFGITASKEIVAVVSDSSNKGAIYSIIPTAIEAGGRWLNCFDLGLPKIYSKFGFVADARLAFNFDALDDSVKEHWDDSTPDLVFMAFNPQVAESNTDFNVMYENLEADTLVSYDDAEKYTKAIVDERESYRYDNGTMLFKDAYDYNNDYHYNFERAVEAKKNNDEETLTKLMAIRDAFRDGLLEAVKDEYFDGVDIVVFNPENVSADFLDGTEASEFVWKLLEDPLVTTYNSREGTEATIHLPSGEDLHLFISARTDNEDFIEYRDSFISNKLMNNDDDEQKTNSYETFVSDAFSGVERNLTGDLHRITYNGGTSRYGAPNYSQSMDYAFSGEGFAEFGVGMYDTSIKDIAKGYAHSIANMKKFRNGEKNLDRIVHTNIISGDDHNFMSWEEPVTMELYHDVVRTLNEMHYNLDDVSIDTSSGENLYRSLADAFNDDAMATQVLKEAGLEGLRYNTDSIFEGKGDGVNYVVFDDAFVRTIMEESYTDSGVRIDSTRFKRPEFMLYKDADISMNEKELADALNDGRFVPNEVLEMYPDNPLVKMERLVQNIVGTKPEWFKLYKRSVDEYLKETGHTFEDFDKWDYKKILDDWNKRLKGANQYMEIPSTDGDYVLMMRRLNAYASMESPEKAETAWMDRLNHTRYGRENIRELAVEMKKKGMFGDTLEGYDLSARYPALSLIAEKTESAEKRGVRPRIDVAVYDSAKDEAFRNRQAIREELNDSNTNNYESNMSETDTNTNYMESADIKEILDEKGVSGEIKDIVRNGIWDGTVVRDLMDKASETLKLLNRTNSTLDLTQRELDIEHERIRLYEQEIKQSEKNKAKVKRLRQLLSETQNRANSLELAYSALADLYATEKLQSALYKTQRQITDIVNSKSGEADTNRAIRDAVKTIMKFTRENMVKNPALKGVIYLDEMKNRVDAEGKEINGKAPALAEFLEDAEIVDKDGNLLKGIDGMNVSELNAFKKAIKADKDGSKDRQKQKERDFDTNTMNLASKIVSSMRPKNIDKVMTPEDRKRMMDEIAEQTEGITSKAEKDRIAEEVRNKTIAKVIQDIADGARYGIEAHSEAINKKRVVDDFTTLSRLLEAVSPELRKFVMNGLNKATDGKYRNVDKRMARFYSNIKEMYKLSSDKKLKEFLNSFVNKRMELKRATFNQIPTRLKANELFMKMWEADEKSGDNKKPSKFQYSIQDMMAIYEHSKEWDGLRHLKGNGIHASEIAWVVMEFESDNGSLEYYRKAADEIQRVYGERFQELYDTVLDVENREMVKVSFYSPMFGIGLNKDLMMKFGELFNDDRKAQASWFTKDRQFGTNPIDLNYYSRLEKIVEMQEAYINGAGFYRQLDHLMSEDGGNLRNIITEVYGEPQYKRIEEILDLTKSDSVRNIISEADNMASKIRNHYVMARLAYNLSSVFQQVGSFFLGLSKYNVVDLWKSSMQFILHPIEMSNRVYELSPQMKHAVNPLIRMAYETGKADPKTVGGKIDKFVASIGEKGLVLMEKQDHIIRNILWWTSYQKEIANAQKAKAKELSSQGITSPTAEQLSLTDDEQEQCQINATQWVLDIQSSSQAKDNSRLYAGGGLFWKNILMFTNQLNKEWNMLYVDGIKEGLFKKDFGKFFANFAALGLATMWVVACTGKIKNDEDDDETWAEDLLKDWGIEFTSRVPLVGNLTKNVYEGFAYRQSDDIVTRLTQAVLVLTKENAKPSSKVTALKNVGWSALDLAGAPTTFIKRTTQAFEDGEIFEADHFMRFFGGEWYKYFE